MSWLRNSPLAPRVAGKMFKPMLGRSSRGSVATWAAESRRETNVDHEVKRVDNGFIEKR